MDRDEATPTTPPTPTDYESITTSTESDTFETWTLVTDKNKKKAAAAMAENRQKLQMTDALSGIEILRRDEQPAEEDEVADAERKEERQQHGPKYEPDSSVDELSDGISIISESDSCDRLTPHPSLHEHLSNLNLRYNTGETALPRPQCTPPNSPMLALLTSDIFEAVSENSQLRQRRNRHSRSRSTSSANEKTALQSSAAAGAVAISTVLHPIVRRGIVGIFYVAVALAVLAFIGKLRYPEWQPLASSSKPIVELAQKLNDMELQNNLMRAEIDILSKQVNYLSGLNEQSKRGGGKAINTADTAATEPQQARMLDDPEFKSKMFKAWLGNGKNLNPVDIAKRDLKQTYKCGDGNFLEIGGMCVDQTTNVRSLVNEVGDSVHKMLQKNTAFQAFEKVAEQLNAFNENPYEKVDALNGKPATASASANEETPAHVDQQYRKWSGERQAGAVYPKGGDNGKHTKQYYEQSPRRQQRFKDHVGKNDSGERYNKHTHTSKDHGAKERYAEKQARKLHQHSGEQTNNQDGHWHEKRMQYRENARRQNEQQLRHNEKNWYIKRGDSREQMRHIDVNHR